MKMVKVVYEAPAVEIVEVKMESGLLTGTNQGVQSSRSGYGNAVTDTWD